MSKSFEIPSSWLQLTLGEVIDYGKSEKAEPSQIPADAWILELEDIEKDTSKLLQRLTFAERQSKSTKNRFSEGDVLYGKLRPYLNKVLIADQDGYCTTEILPFKPNSAIDGRFLFYWLKHPAFLSYVESVSHGLNMPRLGTAAGKKAPLLLAPLNEQKRIADKLDLLLARVDACRERCDRIPLILKRFRQSVLAAATSGELTEEWRETTSTEGLNSGYETLPANWEWRLIREVGNVQLGRQRAPKYHSGEHMRPYLRVQNIFEDRIDLSDVMEMNFPPEDFEKYQLHFGDILLNEGQSPELLGRPAMYRDELPGACFTNTLIRFQAFDIVEPDFALLVFRHYMHNGRFTREGTITTNIAHLGAGRFANIEFPLPPLEEQQEIVRRAKVLFAFADRLESRHQTARAQVNRLTLALLNKAFRGDLVPQDPNDEPASVLLEQIRNELAAAKTNKPDRQQRVLVDSKPPLNQIIMLSREDIQPSHLSSILNTRGSLTAEDLWAASQLEIDDFYDQLKEEEAQGLLKEIKGEDSDTPRLLEAA